MRNNEGGQESVLYLVGEDDGYWFELYGAFMQKEKSIWFVTGQEMQQFYDWNEVRIKIEYTNIII